MQEHGLRRRLSDELHARAFHDFDGAGRFIRFVFLIGSDDSKILVYINKFLTAATLPVMSSDDKFCLHDMASYALRIERHTEFLSISFVEKGLRAKNGLAANAFDEAELFHMPFSWARKAPAPLFHAIWIERWGANRYAAYRKRVCWIFLKVVLWHQIILVILLRRFILPLILTQLAFRGW